MTMGYRALSGVHTNGIPEGVIQWKQEPRETLQDSQQPVQPLKPEYEWSPVENSSSDHHRSEVTGFASE